MRISSPGLNFSLGGVLLGGIFWAELVSGQQALPPEPAPAQGVSVPSVAANTSVSTLAEAPRGIEIQARGPVHEAFAAPTTEPVPTEPVDKRPPELLQEMPPVDKPEGQVLWIPGYWAWDNERADYLWVSGTWRVPPPNKHWVPGYWREELGRWRWVAGFWSTATAQEDTTHPVSYQPAPPAPPSTAPPGEAPAPNAFYVPGHWVWRETGTEIINDVRTYRAAGYAWVPGYWGRVQPGYVWIGAHYTWTPSGYVLIDGYWDLALSRRGFLYAPVTVDLALVGRGFVYTPAYAVPPDVILDAFWVRPCYCHYYFGDYYGGVYASFGFESCAIYSRRCYDPIFGYAVYEHRGDPRWAAVQVDRCLGRAGGRYACPPRTLVEQVRIGYRGPGLVVSARIGEAYGVRTVRLDSRERLEAMHHGEEIRHVALERSAHELHPGMPIAPRMAGYHMPARPRHRVLADGGVIIRSEESERHGSLNTPRAESPQDPPRSRDAD